MSPFSNANAISPISLIVVLADMGDNIAYRQGLHFCEEVSAEIAWNSALGLVFSVLLSRTMVLLRLRCFYKG